MNIYSIDTYSPRAPFNITQAFTLAQIFTWIQFGNERTAAEHLLSIVLYRRYAITIKKKLPSRYQAYTPGVTGDGIEGREGVGEYCLSMHWPDMVGLNLYTTLAIWYERRFHKLHKLRCIVFFCGCHLSRRAIFSE